MTNAVEQPKVDIDVNERALEDQITEDDWNFNWPLSYDEADALGLFDNIRLGPEK